MGEQAMQLQYRLMQAMIERVRVGRPMVCDDTGIFVKMAANIRYL